MDGSIEDRHRVVVLDDDPTGTQEVTGVPVLLRRDRDRLVQLLAAHRSVYVLTNTRAHSEEASRDLLIALRSDIEHAERTLAISVLVVQRGDSTLRGHVFSEIDVYATADSVVVFVPAFPTGGRQTVDGVQLVRIDDRWINAADSEFARDPVFGFSARNLVDFVRQKGERAAFVTSPADLIATATSISPGTVIIVNASSNAAISEICRDIRSLVDSGVHVVVRCAAPLAAYLAGVKSSGYRDVATLDVQGPVLVVAGSHTSLTTRQLDALATRWPGGVEVSTAGALRDPDAEGQEAAERVGAELAKKKVVILSTERTRGDEHSSLAEAARVMRALIRAVWLVRELPGITIAKGGITSAEVASTAFGAEQAWAEGPVSAGTSLWTLRDAGVERRLIIVPGNVGTVDTLVALVSKLVDR